MNSAILALGDYPKPWFDSRNCLENVSCIVVGGIVNHDDLDLLKFLLKQAIQGSFDGPGTVKHRHDD